MVVAVLYIAVAVTLTIWLAQSLYHNGTKVLREQEGQPSAVAEATSRLVVIGFELFTLGLAFLLLRIPEEMTDVEAIGVLVMRLGWLLLGLGSVHLLNTFAFLWFRRSRQSGGDGGSQRREPSRLDRFDSFDDVTSDRPAGRS